MHLALWSLSSWKWMGSEGQWADTEEGPCWHGPCLGGVGKHCLCGEVRPEDLFLSQPKETDAEYTRSRRYEQRQWRTCGDTSPFQKATVTRLLKGSLV